MLHLTIYVKNYQKKQWKISNCSINFFKINFKFLCRHLFCHMMRVLNYCLFLYFRHNISKSFYIYNDIKKVIKYFWIDIFELIWNLIFPWRRYIFIVFYFKTVLSSYKTARISDHIRHLFIQSECLLIECVSYISLVNGK